MSARGKLNILYVSDSLGTPIHARGIFNYSVSFVEILKDLGAEITLVVEKAPGFGLDTNIKRSIANLSSASIAASQLAEVYNNIDAVDFIPIKGEHLRLFHRFLFLNHFYSSSMARAVNGIDPIALDATGYDLVVVDTPHYVRVNGIERWELPFAVHSDVKSPPLFLCCVQG